MFVDPCFFDAIQRFNMALQAINKFVEMNSIAMKFAAKEKGCFPAAGRPGTAANPAYRRVDVDTETGKVSGLF